MSQKLSLSFASRCYVWNLMETIWMGLNLSEKICMQWRRLIVQNKTILMNKREKEGNLASMLLTAGKNLLLCFEWDWQKFFLAVFQFPPCGVFQRKTLKINPTWIWETFKPACQVNAKRVDFKMILKRNESPSWKVASWHYIGRLPW